MASSSAFWKTMGMGVIAGMRSMSAPALLSGALREQPSGRLAHSKFSWLQNGAVSAGLKALAGAEMVGDKLPTMPNRTEPVSVVGRTLSGALVGAALYKLNRQKLLRGAAVGGLGALAGTFGAFALRKLADNSGTTKEPWTGFIEDALVVAGGKSLLHNYQPRQ
ncbi:hypothetical protein PK28_00330 [Hymenobacter sp. DG25B]|uniref:DUF4126 family protein n=1 Tax=Hymenobacter sp. DG25B TaxID=1385664 RepID=UPI000540B8D4|nr:DUF4126 family protein [Hymenobacter sp. DG25B]AIZ62527.1 hypothetical protein PK28_00330 [Hymenobacter sp. DG25B]